MYLLEITVRKIIKSGKIAQSGELDGEIDAVDRTADITPTGRALSSARSRGWLIHTSLCGPGHGQGQPYAAFQLAPIQRLTPPRQDS